MALWPDYVPAALALLPTCQAVEVPKVMFAKITDEHRDGWTSLSAFTPGSELLPAILVGDG